MSLYWRPILQTGASRPADARVLAGGWCWFTQLEVLERGGRRDIVTVQDAPEDVLTRLTAARAGLMGLTLDQPRIMSIVNATPDSFSDGGQFADADAATTAMRAMVDQGADILDIGGESTRPGAQEVAVAEEVARTEPLIRAVAGVAPISIDTRKAAVARPALEAGAGMVNDVAALGFDTNMAPLMAGTGVPVCLMHAQGAPETMQDDPRYEDVLLDVYDGLAQAVARAEAAGIARDRIIVDPGIGFGKTLAHNLTLLRGLGLFHSLGCPVLLGASRKRFIGTITGVTEARQRLAGSLAVAQAAVGQGVQILRVHDTHETKQMLAMTGALDMSDRGRQA